VKVKEGRRNEQSRVETRVDSNESPHPDLAWEEAVDVSCKIFDSWDSGDHLEGDWSIKNGQTRRPKGSVFELVL